MRRDFDLMRAVLLAVEARHDPSQNEGFDKRWLPDLAGLSDTDTHLEAEMVRVNGHLRLLADAGYLVVHGTPRTVLVERITNQGHDFLNLMRAEALWAEVKRIAEETTGVTLALLVGIGEAIVRRRITVASGLDV